MGSGQERVLHGWKQIAEYLDREIRTVQRWEMQRGLPVRRIPGEARSSVYALTTDIDQWLAKDRPSAEILTEDSPQPAASQDELPLLVVLPAEARTRWKWPRLLWAAVAVPLVLAFVLALTLRRHSVLPVLGAPPQPSTRSAPADEQYLQALYLYERRTPSSLLDAEHVILDLTQRQPDNARVWSALAQIKLLLRLYDVEKNPQAVASARAAAERAISLDAHVAEPHAVLGFIDFFLYGGTVHAAEMEFRQAIQIDPACAIARSWYGLQLTYEARYREAREELDLAQSLQPASTPILANRALALGLSGQRTEGLNLLRQAAGEQPLPAVRFDLSVLATVAPRDPRLWLEEHMRLSEASRSPGEIKIYAEAQRAFERGGEAAMWRSIEAACRQMRLKLPILAEAQVALGEKDAAFETLLDLQQHGGFRSVPMDPLLSGLHEDPRYRQLLSASGLPSS